MKLVIFTGVVIAGGILSMTSMQTGLDSRPLCLAGAGTVLNQRGISPQALNVPAGSVTLQTAQNAVQDATGTVYETQNGGPVFVTQNEGPVYYNTQPVYWVAYQSAVLADANAAGEHMDLSDRRVKVEQALCMTEL